METIVRRRDIAHAWIDSWNRHDSAAVAANLSDAGTYTDPATGRQRRADLAAHADAYFHAFPDLRFEIVRIIDGGAGALAVQWVVRGTFTGPLGELQPTGAIIALPGVDVVVVEGDRLGSVEAYWDQLVFREQVVEREEDG